MMDRFADPPNEPSQFGRGSFAIASLFPHCATRGRATRPAQGARRSDRLLLVDAVGAERLVPQERIQSIAAEDQQVFRRRREGDRVHRIRKLEHGTGLKDISRGAHLVGGLDAFPYPLLEDRVADETTRHSGWLARMTLVASMPSRSGMTMSMATMSGASSAASAIACSPS